MAADKEIMKTIERLRLDRPGRVIEGTLSLGVTVSPKLIEEALRELATTFREEAELWSRSGAKGWKGSEAEKYLVAQHIDDVAAQLDNAGGGAALSVSEREPVGQTQAATTHERLDDFVASAVAAGKGTLRAEASIRANPPLDLGVVDVTAYLKGETDTLPGLAEALVPNSITRQADMDNPFKPVATPYCSDCDHDTHRCGGCGEPIAHGEGACAQCNLLHAEPNPCCENMLDAGEDPAPWCDCRYDDSGEHSGSCKRKAHLRANHPAPDMVIDPAVGPDFTGGEFTAAVNAMPKTWESDTLTADGHVKPGVAQTLAPTLGQPGDMGTGYSHSYIPAGGRQVTFAELLTPVPAASLPAHLSHSQANTVGDCATKYRLQRVEALPQIPQWANIGGTAFHTAVEAMERNPWPEGLTAESYDVELAWKHHFEGQITAVAMTTPVPQSVWRAARKGAEGEQWWRVNGPLMLRRYLDARPDEPSLMIGMAADVAIEWEVSADVPTPYGPVPFTAKIDRVTYDERIGGYIIRDYKTSYERPTDTTQLGDYAHALILAKKIFADRPILGSYFDARRGEWTELVDLLQAHPFEAFQYRVTTAHAQKLALTTGPTPARPSSYCGGCAVRYACPVLAARS